MRAALLRLPGGQSAATEAVVLCHGYGSSKDGFHFRALADALAAAGLASLRFDFTGEIHTAGVSSPPSKRREKVFASVL